MPRDFCLLEINKNMPISYHLKGADFSPDTEFVQRTQGLEGNTQLRSAGQFNKHTLMANFRASRGQDWVFQEHRRQEG